MTSTRKPNRLINEKSPYLLQHAYNPVDWHAWNDEAFQRASAEDKPIFLSVGYSTCHWCHVMERESFESEEIAHLMNEYFVSIKVDREERPDVDKVYMTALQAMGDNGGWPMSMFLTPDLKPFYGGTYFPPEDRYGRMGFPELLRRIHHIWTNERLKVDESATGITNFLKEIPRKKSQSESLDSSLLTTCFTHASKTYDAQFGGFGAGPKFPRPVAFNFLLRYFHRTRNDDALEMTTHSLREMSSGGMYDHIGGGFHRYSVDAEWRVPHFEKMLYDQAQIVCSLADIYQITNENFYARTIRETLEYVLRDLTSPEGGFYSAEDADSPRPDTLHESGEGAFYIWTKKELEDILGEDAKAFCIHFGVEETGNVEHDPQHEFTGKNILYVASPIDETAQIIRKSESETEEILARSTSRLFEKRSARPRPHRDDKVITAWNGLMISAFARAGQALYDSRYLEAAQRDAEFILAQLYDNSTRTLRRRYRDGEAKFDAHLDDYAFVVQGLLDLYESTFDLRWLESAVQLTEKSIELFAEEANGGFFETAGSDPSILVRMKEQYDGAEPTGNSIAVMNLLRLSKIVGREDFRVRAEKALQSLSDLLTRNPFTMPQMVAAYDFSIQKAKEIIIVGRRDDEPTKQMIRLAHRRYLPNKIILFIEAGQNLPRFFQQREFLSSLKMMEGKTTGYVCENFVCNLPTNDPGVFARLLDQ
ncbi:MAG: thioredoxin domain-containing protein [Ignavibacteriae bacterium]|nr:thioredoxin domain-containing protein [Ignavibacteriota bacterium]